MTLLRILLAATAVAGWFTLWTAVGRWRPAAPTLAGLRTDALEALLLTCFAALWSASLGHGGWWVLFLVVGVLVEGPVRARHRADLPAEALPWRPLLLGTLRLLGAGAILSFLL